METAVIWKFPLVVEDRQVITVPLGAKLLTVQMQRDQILLWALVNPDEPVVSRRTIAIVGTGHEHKAELFSKAQYIGTVQDYGLVWHIFDIGDAA